MWHRQLGTRVRPGWGSLGSGCGRRSYNRVRTWKGSAGSEQVRAPPLSYCLLALCSLHCPPRLPAHARRLAPRPPPSFLPISTSPRLPRFLPRLACLQATPACRAAAAAAVPAPPPGPSQACRAPPCCRPTGTRLQQQQQQHQGTATAAAAAAYGMIGTHILQGHIAEVSA